jgi:hypothetical protein
MVTSNGTLAHVVAMLTDRGIPLDTATTALSMAGLAIIADRLLTGFCLDRMFAPMQPSVLLPSASDQGLGQSSAKPLSMRWKAPRRIPVKLNT